MAPKLVTDWDDPMGYLAVIRTHLNNARTLLQKFLRTAQIETTGNRPLTHVALGHLYQTELALIIAQLRVACPDCAITEFDQTCSEHQPTAAKLLQEAGRTFSSEPSD